jgi:hypothetical protein
MAEVVLQDYRQVVLSNQTVTASGSAVFDGFGAKELNLLINVSGSVTGTTPTLTFSIQEVDPGDQTTALGNSKTGSAITATGTQIVSLPIMYGGTVKVTWTIGGSGSPTFNGVYASLISKVAGTASLYDASGNPVFGTAGTPGSAVLTIQGSASGTAIPVTGSITATNPSVGTDGSTAPTSSTQVGGPDGSGNLRPTTVKNADPATSDYGLVVRPVNQTAANLLATVTQGAPNTLANAWPVELTDGTNVLGTSSHPVRVDPTGTTTQPVSGTVTANQGGSWSVAATQSGSWTVAATQSGTWTVAQGTAAALSAAWPVEITDGTNVLGTSSHPLAVTNTTAANLLAEVGGLGAAGSAPVGNPVYVAGWDGTNLRALSTDGSGRQLVVGGAAGGAAIVGNPVLMAPLTDNALVGEFAFGESYRLRTSIETLNFVENFDGTNVNTFKWAQSTSTMTQAQAQTSFDMNHNSTTTASTYSILTSNKSFMYTGEYALECRIKAKLTPQTNSVIELGFLTASGTSAPTNGVFFRINSSGTQQFVINFNGTEVTATVTPTLTAADYYTFVVYMYGTLARLDILNFDNSVFATSTLQIAATQGALIQLGHTPVAVRVYNTGSAPSSAPDAILTGVTVSQLDVATNKAWEVQLADAGRHGNLDPLAGTQLQNFTNSAAPATISAASLSNTAAAYSTLGGLFAFNTPASAETDYILFAYQVPANFTLLIYSVTIQTVLLGVQSTTAPTVLQWGLAVGSSAVSLATAAPNPPVRYALGMQQAPKSASVGDAMNPAQLIWTPKVPQACYGGKYVHIILRVPSGNLTSGQINRGIVSIDGVFQ